MTKWFHNSVSGQTFDLDVDDEAGIAAAIKNGAVEIPDPTEQEGEGDDNADKSPDNSPDNPPNGGKPSRRKNGAAKDDGSE